VTARTMLVTGAASGIGAAVTLAAAREAARVAALDVDGPRLAGLAREAERQGADRVLCLEADVSDEPAVERALERCCDELGVPTAALVNAGIEVNGAAHELPLGQWEQLLQVNLTGAFLTARHAIRAMLDAGVGGSVVCTSSPSAFVGFAGGGNAAYAASKGGVSALVRSLALDYAAAGIRVNAVVPGATDTPLLRAGVPDGERAAARDRLHAQAALQIPLGRLGTPMRSPAPSCGCGRTRRPTSPARISWSTAASWPRAPTRSELMTSLAVIGEGLVELELELEPPGARVRLAPGGDAANIAVMAARLDAHARLVARVGDEPLGRWLVACWTGHGVDVDHLRTDPDAVTGLYLNTPAVDGDHRFVYWRTASAGSRLQPRDRAARADRAGRQRCRRRRRVRRRLSRAATRRPAAGDRAGVGGRRIGPQRDAPRLRELIPDADRGRRLGPPAPDRGVMTVIEQIAVERRARAALALTSEARHVA